MLIRFSLIGMAALVALSLLALAVGQQSVSLHTLWEVAQGRGTHLQWIVLWELRVPRLLLALLVGSALATAGAILQGVSRNALASPGLTGVISGATLAIVGLVSGFEVDARWLPVAGFIGGLAAGTLSFCLAWQGRLSPLKLVLAGVAVTSLCTALSTALLLFSGAEASELFFWLAGGLQGRGWTQLQHVWPWVVPSLMVCFACLKPFSVLQLDENTAHSLGISVVRWRILFVVCAVVMTAAVVSVAGPVAFIGLVVPHISRRLVGQSHSLWLPVSAFLGVLVLLAADVLSRCFSATQEAPLGAVTACVGGLWLMHLLRERWS